MNLKTDCARILSAAAVALAAAGTACGAEAKALPSGARMEPHDFNGVRRPASLVELTFAAGDAAVIDIELDGVNMLDDYPTIDWMMDVSQPGAVQVVCDSNRAEAHRIEVELLPSPRPNPPVTVLPAPM